MKMSEIEKLRTSIRGIIMYHLNKEELEDAYIAVNDIFIKSEGYKRFQDKLQASNNGDKKA